ncbi:hypothetical protein [Vibrio phage Va2]|nr:hypothetical protein [Vibrio phage Va2]
MNTEEFYHSVNWILWKKLYSKIYDMDVSEELFLYLTPWTALPKYERVRTETANGDNTSFLDVEVPQEIVKSVGHAYNVPCTGRALALTRQIQEPYMLPHPEIRVDRLSIQVPEYGRLDPIITSYPPRFRGEIDYVSRQKSLDYFKECTKQYTLSGKSYKRRYHLVGRDINEKFSVNYITPYSGVYFLTEAQDNWRPSDVVELLNQMERKHPTTLMQFFEPMIERVLENENWDYVLTDSKAIAAVAIKKKMKTFYIPSPDHDLRMTGEMDEPIPVLMKLKNSGQMTSNLFAAISRTDCDDPNWSDPVLDDIRDNVFDQKVLVMLSSNYYYARKIANVVKEGKGYPLPVVLVKCTYEKD